MQWPALSLSTMLVKNGMTLLIRCVSLAFCMHAARRLMHVVDCLDSIVVMHGLRLMSCLLALEASVASHKCHFRVRHFGRYFGFPVYKHMSLWTWFDLCPCAAV